jgi:hypothetical protein
VFRTRTGAAAPFKATTIIFKTPVAWCIFHHSASAMVKILASPFKIWIFLAVTRAAFSLLKALATLTLALDAIFAVSAYIVGISL